MKRALSFLLCLLLIVPVLTTPPRVRAAAPTLTGSQIPVILIGGDGDLLYDADDNRLFTIHDLGHMTEGGDRSELLKSVANVLQPFLLEGLLQNKWDNYYDQLEKEIGELFVGVPLDENGEVSNGSHIAKAHRDEMTRNMAADKKGAKGYYGFQDYIFWYDWRCDPLAVADELAAYIEGIKASTGAERVAVTGRCVGCNVMLAYLAKYGYDSIYGFGLDGTSSNGGEFISEAISGKFKLDGPALERFLIDYNALGKITVSDFALATIDLLVKSGAVEGLTKAVRATIYDKVVQGVTSALALSTFFTMPCYWAFVKAEDYETAKDYVFGPEGSEKRVKYAGLIEKLDRYQAQVVQQLPELMGGLREHNVNTVIFSKYGFQNIPICASSDVITDQYASVTSSSFGATTADSLYTTLSDEYIAQRVAEGKGKYISPDKQVDASTCIYPDFTWFSKGAGHGDWTRTENELMYTVSTADRQLTVDDFDLTQFMVYDRNTGAMAPMTEENCHTEFWAADYETDHPSNLFQRLRAFLNSLKNWMKAAFEAIKVKIAEKQAEG